MDFLYNIGIYIVSKVLPLAALFNKKLKLGVVGRSRTFSFLKESITKSDKTIWFHCASLGEYEQGLPVFNEIKKDYPNHKIILSFFSPSGYEIRKVNPITSHTIYLPLDTKKNARRFIQLLKPELTVFIKYDIWPNYLTELKKHNLKAILISALLRKDQNYFKFYGSITKKALLTFDHIFTQNKNSKTLLESINYHNVSVAGDTRFDRVYNQLSTNNTLDFVKDFKQDKLCVVAGSTWPEGEQMFVKFINDEKYTNTKFIIAPHNIKTKKIRQLQKELKTSSILYSEKEGRNLSKYNVLIIDTIGLLSKTYKYANIAYVGGALGNTGLHNTLEPAVFGIPIIIGNNYNNFPEAFEMINNKGMYSISNQEEFNSALNNLINNISIRQTSGKSNADYIKKNTGAVIQIMSYLRK